MKNTLYAAGCLLLAATLSSCNDYLKDDSGDLLIPEKVDEFQSVLFGEGYPHTLASDVAFVDLMTDDMTCKDGLSDDPEDGYDSNAIPTGRGAYCWAYDIEYYINDAGNAYDNRYKNILACNIVIENESTMQGIEEERNFCLAQAYALRAYNYFYLVNLYGLPYNKATASKDMGVAIHLESEVTREQFTRNTVQEVYDQINSDLERALDLFDNAKESSNKYLVSRKAVLLLLTRVALFTEDWDRVIQYGEQLREEEGIKLFDMSQMTAEDLDQNDGFCFIDTDNDEIIFNFGGDGLGDGVFYVHKYVCYEAESFYGPMFAVSQEDPDDLWNIYEDGDNRKNAFFWQDYLFYGIPMSQYGHAPAKFLNIKSSTEHRFAFRDAEVLLNLAEAYIQRGGDGDWDEAINNLNELRVARFTAESYQPLSQADFASKEALLEFARTERRRELCFDESHRWMDLRRQGMPRIEHKFHASTGAPVQTYVLEEKDQNYTLSLPSSETSYNMEIEDYPRRDIQPTE